jgi:hypothetical protein
MPYDTGVVQHPDIFNINRPVWQGPATSLYFITLFVGVVLDAMGCGPDILSASQKNLKLFCTSWSCNLYSGFFPGIDIRARIPRSISHNDFITFAAYSDDEYDFIDDPDPVVPLGENCILNLDGNISHMCPDKSNAIYMPFILIESDE